MKITQGSITDRKGPRTNTKELLSNDRQQHAPEISSHCQGIKYYGCVDATVLNKTDYGNLKIPYGKMTITKKIFGEVILICH